MTCFFKLNIVLNVSMNFKFVIPIFICTVYLLHSCNHKQETSMSLFDELDSNNLKKGTAIFEQENDSVRLNKYARELAYQIRTKNVYQSKNIGIELIESEQYKRFAWLSDSASLNTLMDLYRYDNLVLKAYIFEILKIKKYEGLKDLFEQSIDNTNKFENQSGCLGGDTRFNYFTYKCIEDQLSISEKKKYKAMLSKYYDAETWKQMEFFNF